MIKRLALGLVLSAQSLAAQQVVSVQSGEHDGFTRLVLQTDPAADWQVDESRGQAVVSFPGQALNFSTDTVFDRISTARLAGLRAESNDSGSRLILELDCKCAVQSFAFEGNYIVLDVFDGPPLAPVTAAAAPPAWQPDALPFIQPPPASRRFTAYVMEAAPMQPVLLPDPPPMPAPVPEPVLVATALAAPAPPDTGAKMAAMTGAVVSDMNQSVTTQDDPEMRARIEEAQTQLLAQLTRAADQGLVEFVPAPVAVVEAAIPEPQAPPVPEPPVLDPALLQQLSARTAYSQNTEDALNQIVNEFAKPQCLGDGVFLMEGWGGEGSFSDELATLRSSLLGEFDIPDPAIAEKIVQLYLRYGLGAEARLVLSEMDIALENADIYKGMADLLDDDPATVTGPITQGTGCGGAHEMWYLAAGLGDYQVIDPLLISDIFSSYPIEVRTVIGPPLAQAFIDRGQVDVGHVVLEIVRRADGEITAAQQMAEAKVMESQNDRAGAEAIYQDVMTSNDTLAPDALIAFARSVLAADEPVPETLLVDIESAAFFNRDTPRADPLRLWEIRVRAAVAGPEKALAQIVENIDQRPQLLPDLTTITADIFERSRAAEVGDYPYAQMVLRYAYLLDQGAAGDLARLNIAREMAAIGLPETALDVLAPNLTRADLATNIMVAAANVQLYAPAKALAILAGNDSLDAYKIRLQANLQLEDYAAVAAMLDSGYASQISLEDIALRAGDWEKIKAAGAVGTLASFMNNGAQPGPVPVPAKPADGFLAALPMGEAPSLKAARDLLAINRASRSFLEDVLAGKNP